MEIKISSVAKIHNDFKTKFGIPRQSGIAKSCISTIVFEKKFRNPDALRGIEQYSHLWLVWYFSESRQPQGGEFIPTVRPPKLGGNIRMGVFATRSPFRPNPLGLSCVKLERVIRDEKLGTILEVSGADLMDGTEIFDIKPYLPYADCRSDAVGGFSVAEDAVRLDVDFPEELLDKIPYEKRSGLFEVLSQDARPGYKADSDRVYVMRFAEFEVSFTVVNEKLTVCDVKEV